jgi:hypothetical protein
MWSTPSDQIAWKLSSRRSCKLAWPIPWKWLRTKERRFCASSFLLRWFFAAPRASCIYFLALWSSVASDFHAGKLVLNMSFFVLCHSEWLGYDAGEMVEVLRVPNCAENEATTTVKLLQRQEDPVTVVLNKSTWPWNQLSNTMTQPTYSHYSPSLWKGLKNRSPQLYWISESYHVCRARCQKTLKVIEHFIASDLLQVWRFGRWNFEWRSPWLPRDSKHWGSNAILNLWAMRRQSDQPQMAREARCKKFTPSPWKMSGLTFSEMSRPK